MDLKILVPNKNKTISVSVELLVRKNGEVFSDIEYIQGILTEVDIENDFIVIQQYFTYHNLLLDEETTDVKRKLDNGTFKVLSNIKLN